MSADAKPILFSSPMVRALLAGTKTQTRRVVKPQPPSWMDDREPWNVFGATWTLAMPVVGGGRAVVTEDCFLCPYGAAGGRLWVRERLRGTTDTTLPGEPTAPFCAYEADGAHLWNANGSSTWEWARRSLPSIHMPRWASRITLTLTDVRLERLQEISLEDAQAEGGFTAVEQFAGSYAETWDWINGAGSWSTNPWVWALSFSVEVRR